MNANVMAWDRDERRNGSMVVLGAALVVALGALAMWWFVAATPAWLYWALVALLVLVLLVTAVMVFVQPKAQAAPADVAQAAPEAAASAEAAPMQAPAAFGPRVLTLRCGDCGTIFDVTDTGERPLYHTCPGCGAEGALRDPPAAAEASPEPAAAPAAEAYAPPGEAPPAYETPVEPAQAPAAPPVKKIKLRCGGCKEIFSIEDSGERPLRRACPHCGRMGQIN